MSLRFFLLSLLLFLGCCRVVGQTIKGEVRDMDDKHQLGGVEIVNIYTSEKIQTDETGTFSISASSGQLLEFRKLGYKLVRVRIPKGFVPSYFMIIISKGIAELKDMSIAQGNRYDYRNDSIKYHELYDHVLNFPKLSGFDMIASPFSALSRKNREIWQFQEEFDAFEKEKYVDKSFNESLITKFTGLTGDSLHYYMRRYRPTYDQVRNMSDYTFFNYIKSTAQKYRKPNSPRGPQ